MVGLRPRDTLRNDLRFLVFGVLMNALGDVKGRLTIFFLLFDRFVGVAQRVRECQSWGIKDIVPLVRDLGRTVGEC